MEILVKFDLVSFVLVDFGGNLVVVDGNLVHFFLVNFVRKSSKFPSKFSKFTENPLDFHQNLVKFQEIH